MLTSSSKTFALLWRILAAAIGILLITSGIVMAGGVADPGLSNPRNSGQDITPTELSYVPNQIVVKFTSWVDPGELINNGFVTAVRQQLTHSGAYLLDVQPDRDIMDVVTDFDTMFAVEYAHPNYVVNRLHPVQGSYPFSDEQYVGDYSNQPAASMLNLENSHQTATGAGITVAVLDGGVDASYAELSGVMLSGWDYVSGDNDPFDEGGGQISGHGTFVAGVVHLAAPDAQIKPYRVIDNRGYGDGFTLALAIEQAVDDGCNVINISLVLMEEHFAVRDAIIYAESQGVAVVAAAGNEGGAMNLFPAAWDNVISVAAIDSTMLLADFASYGANVDICAPGTMIYSTYKDGLYAWWSGSSFAAPFVAGQVAMLKEVSPASSNLLLEYAITVTGTDIDDINPDVSGQLGGGLTDPPASLGQINSLAIAELSPDTVYIDLYEGRVYFTDPTVGGYLTSTNAPAAYTAEVVDDGAIFSTVTTPSGMTNDSVQVSIQPDGLELGTHYDEVRYTVDGAPEQVSLTICAVMNPPENNATAWFTPNVLLYYIEIGNDSALYGSSILRSSIEQANYTAELNAGAQFTTLFTTSGVTEDTIVILVNPGNVPNAGVYADTVLCIIENVADTVYLPIYLEIYDPDIDTAWVTRDINAYIVAEEGSTAPVTGWLGVYSSNAPANYSVEYLHPPVFSSLPSTVGTTDGNLYFDADPTGLVAGVYYDTLLITIEGVVNNPHRGIATLIVQPPGGGPTGDTCWVYPGYQAFYAPGGVDYIQYGSVFIGSSNAPANYTVSVLDYPDFTVLTTTTGTTDDSLLFEIISRNFTTPGVYTDTLLIDVDGVDNSPRIAVLYLQVNEPNTDSLWLIPDSLYFDAPEGADVIITGHTVLWSTLGATPYTAYRDTTVDWLTVLDSVGLTGDSVTIEVNPSGLTAGNYSEIVWFLAEGISDDAFLWVFLTVTDGSAEDSATLTPTYLYFNAVDGDTEIQTGYSWLSSPNAPAAYTAINDTSNFFLTLIDTEGMTNSSVGVRVDPSGLPTGTYWNYAWYSVDGMVGPSYLTVVLTIDSVALPPPDETAWATPNQLWLTAEEGSTTPVQSLVEIQSSNAPAGYSGWSMNASGLNFVFVPDSGGVTDDIVSIIADPTGLGTGPYADTVLFSVTGVENLVLVVVNLTIEAGSYVASDVQNFPNPFNPKTEIHFSLGAASRVNLTVYNIAGQLVTTLVDQHLEAGEHSFQFDGSNVSSGVYFYRLQTEATVETRKMILLK